jgi:hypothetical protein
VLVALNYIINLPLLKVPRSEVSNYIKGLLITYFLFVLLWLILGLRLYSFDLIMIVLINDYMFFAPILQEIIDEES